MGDRGSKNKYLYYERVLSWVLGNSRWIPMMPMVRRTHLGVPLCHKHVFYKVHDISIFSGKLGKAPGGFSVLCLLFPLWISGVLLNPTQHAWRVVNCMGPIQDATSCQAPLYPGCHRILVAQLPGQGPKRFGPNLGSGPNSPNGDQTQMGPGPNGLGPGWLARMFWVPHFTSWHVMKFGGSEI